MPPLPPTKYPQSKYEKLRDENIERNRRLLEALIAKDRDAGYLRGTKRSATVADERSEDQGEDNEPESQKSVSTVERRVRFPSQTLSRPPKRRQRVDDGLDNAETAPDELWVAKGEDRCKPCKLVGREVCQPQRSASGSCKSCIFCAGETWLCNPPDSWLEKVATLHPKRTRAKTHESSSPTTEMAAVKRQCGHQKASSKPEDVKAALAASKHDIYRTRVMEDINRHLDIITHKADANLVLTMALCNHMGIDLDNFDLDPTTRSMDPSLATRFSAHEPVPQHTGIRNDVGSEDEKPPKEEQGIDVVSQTSNDKHNVTDRLAELQGRMDSFDEWKKQVNHRLKDAGL